MGRKFFKIAFVFLICSLFMGQSVIVQWNRNAEPDVAGYRVYWGNNSGQYTQWKNVVDDTTCVLEDLPVGNYFLAVTAYDTAGNESSFSKEVYFEINNQTDGEPATENTAAYNFPNPFNPEKEKTTIRFFLPTETRVSINIYDVNDELVVELLPPIRRAAGEYAVDQWDGTNRSGEKVSNGIYFAVIRYDFVTKVVTIAVVR